jgi:hypothetical protein
MENTRSGMCFVSLARTKDQRPGSITTSDISLSYKLPSPTAVAAIHWMKLLAFETR